MAAAVETIDAIELGHFLLVEVHPSRGAAFELSCSRQKAVPLLWCIERKCLIFSAAKPVRRKSVEASDMQVRVYRMWHDQEPTSARIETYSHRLGGQWARLGVVRCVDYHSGKWADDAEYTHKSRGGSHLYRLGTGENAVYAIHGKMRATERGLIG